MKPTLTALPPAPALPAPPGGTPAPQLDLTRDHVDPSKVWVGANLVQYERNPQIRQDCPLSRPYRGLHRW